MGGRGPPAAAAALLLLALATAARGGVLDLTADNFTSTLQALPPDRWVLMEFYANCECSGAMLDMRPAALPACGGDAPP